MSHGQKSVHAWWRSVILKQATDEDVAAMGCDVVAGSELLNIFAKQKQLIVTEID